MTTGRKFLKAVLIALAILAIVILLAAGAVWLGVGTN